MLLCSVGRRMPVLPVLVSLVCSLCLVGELDCPCDYGIPALGCLFGDVHSHTCSIA